MNVSDFTTTTRMTVLLAMTSSTTTSDDIFDAHGTSTTAATSRMTNVTSSGNEAGFDFIVNWGEYIIYAYYVGSNRNVWRYLVTFKKTYLAAVTNCRAMDPAETPGRARPLC